MIKVLSASTSVLDHLIFYVVEAPSQPAVEEYFKEIGFAFWNNVEIRQVKLVEDVLRGIENIGATRENNTHKQTELEKQTDLSDTYQTSYTKETCLLL